MANLSLTNGMEKPIKSQLRELRQQLNSISKNLADHGLDFDELADGADDFVHGARKNARRTMRHARKDIDVLSRAAHKAPASAGAVLVVAAAVGFGLGYLLHIAQDH
ncbi:MAG: hypothetical protein RIB57_07685 [Pelagibacterium sp.]|uniref:hypothetical protein n=1 Tax=Pelagibacterium sp. TaxID=1967288 RepID=UPI0032F01605